VPVLVASVNPAVTETLRKLLLDISCGPLRLARQDFPVAIDAVVDFPDRVGVDRLLAALAAHRLTGGATIVVDVGTAITVDAVDASGRFLGGSILPGPTLAGRSLHRYTAALPEVQFAHGESPPAEAIGRNTESAIRSGITYGVAGAVERLVSEQRRVLGPSTPVVATGGGLEVILPVLSCVVRVEPNLVLDGLVASYLTSLK
jgi:type III pantothenate kinase